MSHAPASLTQTTDDWLQDEVSQILTFSLNDEEYGIDILQVNTIRGWTPITHLPDLPSYIRGVLNMHGNIVPIIDLRARFSLPIIEYGPTTVVILLNVNFEDKELVIGIVVDSVSDTYSIKPEDIKQKPQIGEQYQVGYLSGLVEMGDQLILLLDAAKLLAEQQLEQVSNLG